MKLEHEESSTKAVDASDIGPTGKQPRSVQSLSVAWHGLKAAWRLEKAFRNHVFGALAMLAVLVALRPEPIWWALALLCSTLLIALELINTSIERLIDHVDRSSESPSLSHGVGLFKSWGSHLRGEAFYHACVRGRCSG